MSREREFLPVNIAVMTVSDTRTLENDKSGDTLVDRLDGAGHKLVGRVIVPDERDKIISQLKAWIDDSDVDVRAQGHGAEVRGGDEDAAGAAEGVPDDAPRPGVRHVAHDQAHLHVHRRRAEVAAFRQVVRLHARAPQAWQRRAPVQRFRQGSRDRVARAPFVILAQCAALPRVSDWKPLAGRPRLHNARIYPSRSKKGNVHFHRRRL